MPIDDHYSGEKQTARAAAKRLEDSHYLNNEMAGREVPSIKY